VIYAVDMFTNTGRWVVQGWGGFFSIITEQSYTTL